jgi:hypothetical protein
MNLKLAEIRSSQRHHGRVDLENETGDRDFFHVNAA